jgi:hypothetical protein
MPSLASLFSEGKEEGVFRVDRIAYLGKDGQCFPLSYDGGGLITDSNLNVGKSVVLTKDNQGKTQILGQNFR